MDNHVKVKAAICFYVRVSLVLNSAYLCVNVNENSITCIYISEIDPFCRFYLGLPSPKYINQSDLLTILRRIKTYLLVDYKNTSSYRRSMTSAHDDRISAVLTGYSLGVLVLCGVAFTFLLTDLSVLFQKVCRQKANKSQMMN